jgi:hypothetical protein
MLIPDIFDDEDLCNETIWNIHSKSKSNCWNWDK